MHVAIVAPFFRPTTLRYLDALVRLDYNEFYASTAGPAATHNGD